MRQMTEPQKWRFTYTVDLPFVTRSIANLREHWRPRSRRTRSERDAAFWQFAEIVTRARKAGATLLPCVVVLTRQAPAHRHLDSDNLAISFKAIRDGIADRLKIDDRDPRVEWRYAQQVGDSKTFITYRSIT